MAGRKKINSNDAIKVLLVQARRVGRSPPGMTSPGTFGKVFSFITCLNKVLNAQEQTAWQVIKLVEALYDKVINEKG
jgi:hypothetical protein